MTTRLPARERTPEQLEEAYQRIEELEAQLKLARDEQVDDPTDDRIRTGDQWIEAKKVAEKVTQAAALQFEFHRLTPEEQIYAATWVFRNIVCADDCPLPRDEIGALVQAATTQHTKAKQQL